MNNQLPFLEIVDGILTQQECNDLILKADESYDKEGVEITERGIGDGTAAYYRTEISDPQLASNLMTRLRDRGLLPREYNIVSILPDFRLAKYNENGRFPMHKDGIKQDRNGNRSIMTLNIFLNDKFDGGETDFYLEDQSTLRMRAIPKTGSGALFYSRQYHCGNEVKNGYKYLLRSYLMSSSF